MWSSMAGRAERFAIPADVVPRANLAVLADRFTKVVETIDAIPD